MGKFSDFIEGATALTHVVTGTIGFAKGAGLGFAAVAPAATGVAAVPLIGPVLGGALALGGAAVGGGIGAAMGIAGIPANDNRS